MSLLSTMAKKFATDAGPLRSQIGDTLKSGKGVLSAFGDFATGPSKDSFNNLFDAIGEHNENRSRLAALPGAAGMTVLDNATGGFLTDTMKRRKRKQLGVGPLTERESMAFDQTFARTPENPFAPFMPMFDSVVRDSMGRR